MKDKRQVDDKRLELLRRETERSRDRWFPDSKEFQALDERIVLMAELERRRRGDVSIEHAAKFLESLATFKGCVKDTESALATKHAAALREILK